MKRYRQKVWHANSKALTQGNILDANPSENKLMTKNYTLPLVLQTLHTKSFLAVRQQETHTFLQQAKQTGFDRIISGIIYRRNYTLGLVLKNFSDGSITKITSMSYEFGLASVN